jgi:hypothetical protein
MPGDERRKGATFILTPIFGPELAEQRCLDDGQHEELYALGVFKD